MWNLFTVAASRSHRVDAFNCFDSRKGPAALLAEARYTESLHIFLFQHPGHAALSVEHLHHRLDQIALDPKQCSSDWLGHFYLAQDKATSIFFSDHGGRHRSTLKRAPFLRRGSMTGVRHRGSRELSRGAFSHSLFTCRDGSVFYQPPHRCVNSGRCALLKC